MIENIQFVDTHDVPSGSGTREEAWSTGTPVRVVRVILRDEKGRILSQQRSKYKQTSPNCWTDSASGHVDAGESCDVAVARELKEEIGITTDLKYIGKFYTEIIQDNKHIKEFHHVYEGIINSNTEFSLDPEEVNDIRWINLDELKKEIAESPNEFTHGLREIIARFYA